MSTLLSLDLSTTSTGWAEFEDDKLKDYGIIKPKLERGKGKAPYPLIQLYKINSIVKQILEKTKEKKFDVILIEEINRGKNRLGQKTLDGLHWLLIECFWQEGELHKVKFFDSDGANGWRSKNGLKLQLTPQDKLVNKERRQLNKKLAKNEKLPLITQKTLSCRFVSKEYNLNFSEKENDITDAIGLGHFYIHKVLK